MKRLAISFGGKDWEFPYTYDPFDPNKFQFVFTFENKYPELHMFLDKFSHVYAVINGPKDMIDWENLIFLIPILKPGLSTEQITTAGLLWIQIERAIRNEMIAESRLN